MKQETKRQQFADKVGSATMSEKTREIMQVKGKLHDLIEDIGDWRNKYELISDEDFNEIVLCSVEFEDMIDHLIIRSVDENLRSSNFVTF